MRVEGKYEVGDKVVLRNDLRVGDYYGFCELITGMEKSIGQVVEILNIYEDGDFQIDNEEWYYSTVMIDEEATRKLNEKPHERKYKVGDVVEIREDLEEYKNYGHITFHPNMQLNEGKINNIGIGGGYRLDDGYYYSEEMIKGLKNEEILKNDTSQMAKNSHSISTKMWILTENREKKEINIKDLINRKDVAIHCDTREKAKEILRKLDSLDIGWIDGSSATQNDNYRFYEEYTCYSIGEKYNKISFSGRDYYEKEGFHIYEYILDNVATRPLKVWELECGKRYKQLQIPIEHAVFEMDEDGDLIRISSHGIRESELELNFLKSILQYEFEEIEGVFPREGEWYYAVQLDACGIDVEHYKWENDDCDSEMLNCNNVFKTKEEAEFKLEEIKKVMGIK